MRKLKLQMHMSFDGFVARPNGETNWMWLGKPDPAAFQKVIAIAESSDTILLGRKMTSVFINHWENIVEKYPDSSEQPLAQLMVNTRKIVFSRTQKELTGKNLEAENGDLLTVVNVLKQQPGKDILVYGGAAFVNSLITHNLIDEYYFFINPVAIGSGFRIFTEQKVLELQETVIFTNGKMLCRYK